MSKSVTIQTPIRTTVAPAVLEDVAESVAFKQCHAI